MRIGVQDRRDWWMAWWHVGRRMCYGFVYIRLPVRLHIIINSLILELIIFLIEQLQHLVHPANHTHLNFVK